MDGFIKKLTINNFRKFKKIEFKLGSRITVLSGVNGVGKSSLLSLLSSTTGTKEYRLNKSHFQPEFNEYFKISPQEDFKNYKLYVDFRFKKKTFVKRIGFKDDTKNNRGIRPIPRTSVSKNSNLTIKQAAQNLKNSLNIGDSSRVPIPTIYLSLSRLYPLGEHDSTISNTYSVISRNANIYKYDLNMKYAEYYNEVLPNSIDIKKDYVTLVNKAITKKSYLKMAIDKTSDETISVGEDNLSSIITCLVDFYELKRQNPSSYCGGILCIDEIDSSLHPSAVINLIGLLSRLSNELSLQIILTSHSLIVLSEILRLHKDQPSDYQLVYFKDRNIPAPTHFKDFTSLKANLYNQNRPIVPTVKVYAEDDVTVAVLNMLIETYKDIVSSNLSNTDIPKFNIPKFDAIAIHLGKNQLRNLPVEDSYFNQVVLLLDGDGHLKNSLNIEEAFNEDNELKTEYIDSLKRINKDSKKCRFNEVCLPSCLPPELFLYNIIKEYANHPEKHYNFWRDVDKNPDAHSYDSELVQEKIDTNHKKIDKEFFNSKLKGELQQKILDFTKLTNILTDYYSDPTKQDELIDFINIFTKQVSDANERIKSNNL
ncbi:hypothetical protein ERK18_09010 [Lactobacillus kimbladii]|uniref:AAA family ATPase n=1 Tax=Lactobacillus kimbladii TaxID=1218506 RepID=UPI00164F8F4A|nr:AAA family ATPase [Lactobacillus kimbladii]MBC6343127.1 hypothetical protein [Lactobacillus kimbladii]